jgi:hypothetical protein
MCGLKCYLNCIPNLNITFLMNIKFCFYLKLYSPLSICAILFPLGGAEAKIVLNEGRVTRNLLSSFVDQLDSVLVIAGEQKMIFLVLTGINISPEAVT